MSLKLTEKLIEIDGHVYPLRCNMAVLERLQDGPGAGEIGNLLERPTYQVVFDILAAMIADACEDNPELPEISMKRLKKQYSPAQLGEFGIFHMFVESLAVPTSTDSSKTETGIIAADNSGN